MYAKEKGNKNEDEEEEKIDWLCQLTVYLSTNRDIARRKEEEKLQNTTSSFKTMIAFRIYEKNRTSDSSFQYEVEYVDRTLNFIENLECGRTYLICSAVRLWFDPADFNQMIEKKNEIFRLIALNNRCSLTSIFTVKWIRIWILFFIKLEVKWTAKINIKTDTNIK